MLVIKSTPSCLPSKLKVWPQSTHLGKIIVIGAIQVSGHSLKLHFWMFERSQGKHNSLDCHKFLKYFPLIVKFTCSKLDSNQKCFFMFKALKLWESIVLACFFQMSVFSIKCASLFLKIREVLTLMIRKTKGLELMNFFNNPFEHIWFKSAFDLENYEFWKYDFNKSYSYICDRRHEYII